MPLAQPLEACAAARCARGRAHSRSMAKAPVAAGAAVGAAGAAAGAAWLGFIFLLGPQQPASGRCPASSEGASGKEAQLAHYLPLAHATPGTRKHHTLPLPHAAALAGHDQPACSFLKSGQAPDPALPAGVQAAKACERWAPSPRQGEERCL